MTPDAAPSPPTTTTIQYTKPESPKHTSSEGRRKKQREVFLYAVMAKAYGSQEAEGGAG